MSDLPIKVLLVEDDDEDYLVVRDLLSRIPSTRYELDWVMSYHGALDAAERARYDICLLDYRLGERNGLDLLNELRERGCRIPIVILTGQADYEVDVEAMKTGASDFLLKDQINGPLLDRSIRYAIEHKRSEENLRKSEEKYRRIVDTALEGIWMLDNNGTTTYVNQRMADMLGFTIQEICDRSPFDFADDPSRLYAQRYFKPRGQGIGEQHDLRFRCRDGSDLWAIVSSSPTFDDHGVFIGTLNMISDITERKQAEEALKGSEEKMRLIIESSPMGIRICRRSRCVYANPAFARMFGYDDPEEIQGLAEEGLYAPEDRTMIRQRQKDWFEGKPVLLSYEARGLRKNGSHFDVCVWPTRIDYRNEPAILDFVIDVSSEKALQAQLVHAQKMQALGILAGGIAHDFNNILSIVLGFTEFAMQGISKDSRPFHNLEHVLKAVYRAIDLVNQILTFSRQTEQVYRPVQIRPVVKETLKLLRALLPSNIEIRQRIDVAAGEDIIMTDPTRIHQVLMNLCTNSAHAMREKGGIIHVELLPVHFDPGDPVLPSALNPGSYVRLTVSDTGMGISPEIMDQIFDPYFTTKLLGEGTGLGLGVVHGIVKSHGGAVTVHSSPDRGTVFHVFLPRSQEGVRAEIGASGPLPRGNERILFIDDEERLVEMGRQMLGHLGYDVLAGTSSLEALEAFRADPDGFDMILTDQTMPQMTGAELAKEVLRVRPGMPIVLCTGFSEIITAEKAKSLGIREYIMKPLSMHDMATTVRRVLDESRQAAGRAARDGVKSRVHED